MSAGKTLQNSASATKEDSLNLTNCSSWTPTLFTILIQKTNRRQSPYSKLSDPLEAGLVLCRLPVEAN